LSLNVVDMQPKASMRPPTTVLPDAKLGRGATPFF
jgi:hypothetical protein